MYPDRFQQELKTANQQKCRPKCDYTTHWLHKIKQLPVQRNTIVTVEPNIAYSD